MQRAGVVLAAVVIVPEPSPHARPSLEPGASNITVTVASATSTGRRRTNADAALIDEAAGLYMIADGMGDSPRSGVVARAALAAVRELFLDVWTVHPPSLRSTAEAAARLRLGVVQANGRLFVGARESRCGTTFAGVVVCKDRLCVASVGDSRVYLLRAEGRLVRLTDDDTPAASGSGILPRGHSRALTRAIGTQRTVEAWPVAMRWDPGDIAVLTTDGVTDAVDDDALAATLRGAEDLVVAAGRLLVLAEAAGAADNATVMLVRRDQ